VSGGVTISHLTQRRRGAETQRLASLIRRQAVTENDLSGIIIGAAIEVHRELGGPGLLEDVYEEALCHELELRGLRVKRQVGVKIEYKGRLLKAVSVGFDRQ
jgi:hypothetical protein